MTQKQRRYYHSSLWPRVCAAQGWDPRDDSRRRSCTEYATGQESSATLDQHGITALFAYLGHLAGDPVATDRWLAVSRSGARAVNLQLQGEHHRAAAGIADGGHLDLRRFRKLGSSARPDMSEPEAEQYLMTMRRARRSRAAMRRPAASVAAAISADPF